MGSHVSRFATVVASTFLCAALLPATALAAGAVDESAAAKDNCASQSTLIAGTSEASAVSSEGAYIEDTQDDVAAEESASAKNSVDVARILGGADEAAGEDIDSESAVPVAAEAAVPEVEPSGSLAIFEGTPEVTFSEFNAANGSFGLIVSGCNLPAGSSLVAAVWSDEGGQDDLKWVNLAPMGDGNYARTIYISDHNCSQGLYVAHVFIKAPDGTMTLATTGETTVSMGESSTEVSVWEDESLVEIWVSGGLANIANKVVVPVWSDEGGQNDIVWYDAERGADGRWHAVVQTSRHHSSGAFTAHAYVEVGPATRCVAAGNFAITAPTGKVAVTGTGNGYFTVEVSSIASNSPVAGVKVPVWTASGDQDDIVWMEATPDGDKWVCRVTAGEHMGEDGTYVGDAYVSCANGAMANVGGFEAQVSCIEYVFVTGSQGSTKRTVWIKNPASVPVTMVAWSIEGGQDDVTYYPTEGIGAGLWRATIDCSRFKHPGTVVTQVFVNGRYIDVLEYEISSNEILPEQYRDMFNRVQGLASSSSYLVAADTNRCFVGIFSGSVGNWSPVMFFQCSPGAYGSPSRKGIFTISSKGYAFGTSSYTCYYYSQYSGNYLFHSVLYNAGTRVIQDGRLGMHLSHGCIRLAIENAKWIYDNVPIGSRVLVY